MWMWLFLYILSEYLFVSMWFSQTLQYFLPDYLRNNWKHKTERIFPVWFILFHVFLLLTVKRKEKWVIKSKHKTTDKNKENKQTRIKKWKQSLRERKKKNSDTQICTRKMEMTLTKPCGWCRLARAFQKSSSSLKLQERKVKENTIVDNRVGKEEIKKERIRHKKGERMKHAT